MIVAWDARKLFDGGIGTYIRGLLSALAAAPSADDFVALVDPRDLGRAPWSGSVRERAVRAGKYGLVEHWAVPAAARAAGARLLHAPHYTLPLGWRRASVVTIHDLIHLRYPQYHPPGTALYARFMAGAAVRAAREVIVDSAFTRDDVVSRLGAKLDRVHVVPLGVSPALAAAAAAARARVPRPQPIPHGSVLYVGARKGHKNLALLLRAWATMRAESRPSLVLTGERWAADDSLAKLARALCVESSVRFAGDPMGDAAMGSLYAAASLLVQPSLCEGFGLPPLEAMACGTPVLSSDAASLPEVVGDAAVLLPPREPEAWAAAVQSLLGDSARLAELAERGRVQAAAFTWERAAASTRAVYERAVARG